MSGFVAALPMYDWPERRQEVDAEWATIRDRLRAAGIDAPDTLARRNADLPPVPGGIRDGDGRLLAPDPASLPPEELDLPTLWRHPDLLLSQTCWGPMRTTGLWSRVTVVGQPDYPSVPGGCEASYSSAIVSRRPSATMHDRLPPPDGRADLPAGLAAARLAVNDPHSLSGWLGIEEDASAAGIQLRPALISGSHRASIRAVAAGEADIAAIDCRSWALAKRFEPAAQNLIVAGWTARRIGLPFIASRSLGREAHRVLREALRPRLDLDRLRRRLASSGIARPDSMQGCSEAEIAAIEARHGKLPRSYREVLSMIGRSAGSLVDDREIAFHHHRLERLNADVRNSLAEAAASGEPIALPTEPAFFISARHGEYQSCILANGGEDSPVWTYDETMENLTRTHDSVWDWLHGFVADAEYWIALGMRRTG
jgi:ABC-type phosphate/phosphonate transport system substrate-binding protein